MDIEKLKHLRMLSRAVGQNILADLIDILIESSAGASDRVQPVAEVGGGASKYPDGKCNGLSATPALKSKNEVIHSPYLDHIKAEIKAADERLRRIKENNQDPRDELIRDFMHWIRCEGDSVEQLQQIQNKAKAMGY